MSRWYRRTKRDGNHKPIVDALKKAGCSVLDLAAVGGGCPDLLCYSTRSGYVLLEVKVPGFGVGKKNGKLFQETADRQAKFRREWLGRIHVVESIDEAIAAVSA